MFKHVIAATTNAAVAELVPPILRRVYGPGRKNPFKGVTQRAYDRAHSDARDPAEISRQTRRAQGRAFVAQAVSEARAGLKQHRDRACSERQTAREKTGFYDGRLSVAAAKMCRRAGRLHRRVLIDDTARERSVNLRVLW